jgi:hypothetical protein
MLRQVTVIILLIAFSAHTLQRTVIVLDYYTNTESFAQRCINKLRPSMNCNGKCLLMKKLKEEEKKDQQAPARKLENKIDLIAGRSFVVLPAISESKKEHISNYTGNLLTGHSNTIFHPPSLC